MSHLLGARAVVVGSGFAGMTAAGVLADWFENVTVLERDALPKDTANRRGAPQGRHAHALLAGGQRALESIFPGFSAALEDAGAIPLRVAADFRYESPGYDPFPQRDFGWHVHSMSRPLAEYVARRQLTKRANVDLRQCCRVEAITTEGNDSNARVSGVDLVASTHRLESLDADLVIDASNRGALTLATLRAIGCAKPPESKIGVNVGYATAVFASPEGSASDRTCVYTLASAPENSRAGIIMPIEGNRWMLTLMGMHGDSPPGDMAGFVAFASQLRTTTIRRAVQEAKAVSGIARFALPESVRRHFEQLELFPRGLVPIGDALCRFNPIYGQGMSVASQQACVLSRILSACAESRDPLEGLAPKFFAAIQETIDTPWATAAIGDLIYPKTRGERPAGIEKTLKFGLALNRLASREPDVHRLMLEVRHLLKPRSAYRDPALVERVSALMTEG